MTNSHGYDDQFARANALIRGETYVSPIKGLWTISASSDGQSFVVLAGPNKMGPQTAPQLFAGDMNACLAFVATKMREYTAQA